MSSDNYFECLKVLECLKMVREDEDEDGVGKSH